MVYTGRPSRACANCKKRRIKCDETRPQCQNCLKSKRECPGFPDEFDVRLRDQTERFIRGHWAYRRTNVAIAPAPTQLEQPIDTPDSSWSRPLIHDFFEDFVFESSDLSISRGYFNGLKSRLDEAEPDGLLWNAVEALAILNRSKKPRMNHLSSQAAEKYGLTLSKWRSTVEDPEKSVTDESLTSVLVMALYEILDSNASKPEGWSHHLEGIALIMATRWTNQSITDIGSSVFLTLASARTHGLSPSFSFDLNAPNALQTPSLFNPSSSELPNIRAKPLDALYVELCPFLRHSADIVGVRQADQPPDIHRLLQDAQDLLGQFEQWPKQVMSEWQPRTVGYIREHIPINDQLNTDCTFCTGKLDVFYDLYVAGVWTTYRLLYLLLLGAIVRFHLEAYSMTLSDFFSTDEHHALASRATSLANDIAASVPYHLIGDKLKDVSSLDATLRSPVAPRILGGLFLTHAVYAASIHALVPQQTREWMHSLLRGIGRWGVGQADVLVEAPPDFRREVIDRGELIRWAGSLI